MPMGMTSHAVWTPCALCSRARPAGARQRTLWGSALDAFWNFRQVIVVLEACPAAHKGGSALEASDASPWESRPASRSEVTQRRAAQTVENSLTSHGNVLTVDLGSRRKAAVTQDGADHGDPMDGPTAVDTERFDLDQTIAILDLGVPR